MLFVKILFSLRCAEDSNEIKYNIEFRFDCDCEIKIRIHYFATETLEKVDVKNKNKTETLNQNDPLYQLKYSCACNSMFNSANVKNNCICFSSDIVTYQPGANQLFKQPNHFIYPSRFNYSCVSYS
jgi:hypothetical protein